MPIITKISVQKNNKERFNIFLDKGKGEEYAFSVDEDVLIKYRLTKGMRLDELLLTEINFYDEIRKAYNAAVQYLAKRKRTEAEVRKYLREKETVESVVREVILKLYEYKFLDDEDYALSYVRTQMNTADKGPEVIKKELQQRGVDDSLIDEAMREYPFERQFETALQLCEKFAGKNQRDSKRILQQKMEQLLLRKGFPYDMIASVIAELDDKTNNTEEEMNALRFQGEKAHRKYAKLEPYQYRQKMKEALYRKGFSFELIEEYLSELDLE